MAIISTSTPTTPTPTTSTPTTSTPTTSTPTTSTLTPTTISKIMQEITQTKNQTITNTTTSEP